MKYVNWVSDPDKATVAPLTGAWIEIAVGVACLSCLCVAPFTGAWIEIRIVGVWRAGYHVAPFTGAWIEIFPARCAGRPHDVAPFTGAWIEIIFAVRIQQIQPSLPSRERGLKSAHGHIHMPDLMVAPFTGAWIEIVENGRQVVITAGRSLHGSVD